VNLSLNEIAAHYTPSANDKTTAHGLLKIDIGVCVNGYIADTAFSVDLSEDGKFKEMIELNKKALENVISKLTINSEAKDVGDAISEIVSGSGFSVIRNLSGHSLDKNRVHSGLTISNYKNENKTKLAGMAVAVEPFLTQGEGKVYDGKASEIFILEGDGKPRDADARVLLDFIKQTYKTRPFCKRWLEKKKFRKLNFILKTLTQQGILHNFNILIETGKKPVSQQEHTMLFLLDKVEVITR
jgi:methionyl aminopeptidase